MCLKYLFPFYIILIVSSEAETGEKHVLTPQFKLNGSVNYASVVKSSGVQTQIQSR